MSGDADVAIVGGGPAGSAAAIGCARAGLRTILFERERAAHPKVCGEFISGEACEELRELGVDPLALGAAPIDRVSVECGTTRASACLPFIGASLSRAALDDALLARAAACGVDVRRGTRVIAIDDGNGVPSVAFRDMEGAAERARVRNVVLASGKTEMSGHRRGGARTDDRLGFKMHLEFDGNVLEQLGRTVELTVFAGGYAGMQRIEDGRVAFALVVDRATFARAGSWPALIESIVRAKSRFSERAAARRDLWPRPLAISGVPYGFVHRDDSKKQSTLYRAGDQLAVIPSFTGDGIAIALASGSSAARAIATGRAAYEFHAQMRRRLARPMRVASLVSATIANSAGRGALVFSARAVPSLFAFVAAQTRIPREDDG